MAAPQLRALVDKLSPFLQRSADKKTNFLKVYAPWDLLTRYAEIFNLKMPIKVRFVLLRIDQSAVPAGAAQYCCRLCCDRLAWLPFIIEFQGMI